MLPAILHISHARILWALWKHTARDLLADWNNILWQRFDGREGVLQGVDTVCKVENMDTF